MTDTSIERRLTELETRMRGFQELQTERNTRTTEIIADLRNRSEQQDGEITDQIAQIHTLLWQMVWWAVVFLTGTLSTIILKALNLL